MTDVDALAEQWGNAEVLTVLHAVRWGIDLEAIGYRLQNDPQFAAEMRLCKEWRIPHSEFLGWSTEDQKKALGHFFYEAQRCGQCGIHPSDWPDPEEPVFDVEWDHCPGCDAMSKAERRAKQAAEDHKAEDALDGQKPYLKRRTDA